MTQTPRPFTAKTSHGAAALGAALCVAFSAPLQAIAQSAPELEPATAGAVAYLTMVHRTVQIGQPIWADFTICNPTDQPLRLGIPNPRLDLRVLGATALPIEHVFSGPGLNAVRIAEAADNSPVEPVSRHDLGQPPAPIVLDPAGIIGLRVNLAEYFPGLQRTGTFYLTWMPYGGTLVSNRARITIQQLKQAVIETSLGKLTVAFEYQVAPAHVANFIELAEDGFYDNKTFHMVVPGALVHGGCPRGDGTGLRADGKLIPAEFSDIPHRVGTVSMSRKASDPDSASCQFFICLTRLAELDGQYTAFGHVVGQDSFDTLQKLSRVQTDERDRPVDPIYIHNIHIENAPIRGSFERVEVRRR